MFPKGPVKGGRRRGRAYCTIIINNSTVITAITLDHYASLRLIAFSQKAPSRRRNKSRPYTVTASSLRNQKAGPFGAAAL